MTMRHIEGRGGLRPFLKDPDKAKAGLAKLLVQGAKTWKALYGEIDLPALPPSKSTPLEQPSQSPLRDTIVEYRRGVRTPEFWTAYWRAKFQIDATRDGVSFEIPDCDWSEEEIRRPMVDIQGHEVPGLMVPVVDDITLPILGRMYPGMQSATVKEDTRVVDTHNTRGWVKVYASVDGPNLNTGRADAERFAREKGYLLGRELTYILGANALKDLEGKYFDQGPTWSWLPGSQIDDELGCCRLRFERWARCGLVSGSWYS